MAIMIPGTSMLYDPTTESTSHLISEMRLEQVDKIKRAAKLRLFKVARDAYPRENLIIRDMTPQDLEETNIEWTDTTGGADDWEDHQIASQSVADGRFVCIYGCHVITPADATELPVTALKFDVGGSKVALWDIHKAWPTVPYSTTIANVDVGPIAPGLITESPIIISQNITVTISQWSTTNALAFCLILDGYTCEIEGKVLRP